MKLRAPRRFATAVTRIKNALGDETCAKIVGRSPSLIRKWADPDHPSRPNLPQALALDIAFVEEGHGHPPILSLYQQRLARAVSEQSQRPPVDVALAGLSVQVSVGDISESILTMQAGNRTFSPNQKNKLFVLLERLQQQAINIEDALDDDTGRLE